MTHGASEATPSFIRVGVLQAPPAEGVREDEIARFREGGVQLLALPEYFWIEPDDRDHRHAGRHAAATLERLAELSQGWCVVGGTFVEPAANGGWQNTCPVFEDGREVARYRKINLMPGERKNGAVPGASFVTVTVAGGVRLAPVICADVLDAGTFSTVASLGADLIVAPVASPYLPDDSIEAKQARDQDIFVAGAARAGAPIVKVCGVGSVFTHRLQGRSLVAAPHGVVFRTPFDQESERGAWIVDVPLAARDDRPVGSDRRG